MSFKEANGAKLWNTVLWSFMKDLTINKTLGKSSSLVSSKKGLGT